MSRLKVALDHIVAARKYTSNLIEDIDTADWFRQPAEGVSHIGWQVAHLAVAQYWLALNRVRGRRSEDEQLISESFLKRFGRESVPDPMATNNPSTAELRDLLDRVHQQTLLDLKELPESELDQPVSRPHRMFTNKLEALYWCGQHEFVHAGQIGLLRRLLGYPPQW
jgi:uncharacterized damage-inducible protein DinB